MQRRRWLQWGIAGAATLAVLGGGALLWQPAWDESGLSDTAGGLVSTLAEAILDGSLPTAPPARAQALEGLLARTEDLIRNLPSHSQDELGQLLGLLNHPAGRVGLAGLHTPWAQASVEEVQQALQGMRLSSVSLKRQAYQALHDVIGGAYYADPSTWTELGYPGPQAV